MPTYFVATPDRASLLNVRDLDVAAEIMRKRLADSDAARVAGRDVIVTRNATTAYVHVIKRTGRVVTGCSISLATRAQRHGSLLNASGA